MLLLAVCSFWTSSERGLSQQACFPLQLLLPLPLLDYCGLIALESFILVFTDGAGLFCGVLQHLAELGDNCPKVFSATHFHEIFTNDMLGRDLPIEYHHMQAMLSRGTDGEYIDLDEATETQTSTVAQSSSQGTVEIQYLYRSVDTGTAY